MGSGDEIVDQEMVAALRRGMEAVVQPMAAQMGDTFSQALGQTLERQLLRYQTAKREAEEGARQANTARAEQEHLRDRLRAENETLEPRVKALRAEEEARLLKVRDLEARLAKLERVIAEKKAAVGAI